MPPPAFFVASGFSQYLGAAIAIGLFVTAPSFAVAWARIAVAALVLLAWRRPWRLWMRGRTEGRKSDGGRAERRTTEGRTTEGRTPDGGRNAGRGASGRGLSGRSVWLVVLFGLALGGLNIAFYLAIARIHLGTAVSLEYLGPVLVAAVGGRGWAGRVAVGLALTGVGAIGGLGLDLSAPGTIAGAAFAIGAGAFWAAYVVLGRRVATSLAGMDALALAMTVAALAYAPVALPAALPLFGWDTLAAVIGVAVLSSAVPYAVDQLAFARIPAATFALLTALLPATSLAVGLVVLFQVPSLAEVLGLVLVSIAVWLASTPRFTPPRRPAD
ncbi:putative integral membrane protein [Actinomycetales bacterium JB111]|nr:putative integral membrane protein [Actinomycetales bacterium JB111]